MSIRYSDKVQTRVNDAFTQQFREIHDHFSGRNSYILGEGHAEVLYDNDIYEDYRDMLLEGLGQSDKDALEQIMDNSRVELLGEQGMSSGITPVTSLTLPMIRKTWPKLAITQAIPVEAVEKPKFSFIFLQPWMRTEARGDKKHLPEALMPEVDSDATDSDEIYKDALGGGGNRPPMLPVGATADKFVWRQVTGYRESATGTNDGFSKDATAAGDFTYGDVTTLAKGVDQSRTVKLSDGSASFNIFDRVSAWGGTGVAYTGSELTARQKELTAKTAADLRYNGLDVDVRVSGVYMQCFPQASAGVGSDDANHSMVVKIEHAARDTATTNRPTTSTGDPAVLPGGSSAMSAAYEGFAPMNVGESWTRSFGTASNANQAYRTRGGTPLRDVAIMDTRTGLIGPIRVAGLNDRGNYDAQDPGDDGTQAVNSAVSEMDIIIHVNKQTGDVTCSAHVKRYPSGNETSKVGPPVILGVEFEMQLNQQLNENVLEVGFDITDREVNIPTAQHLAAPLPEEYLTDLLRMFDIDGVSKAVDLISNTIAQSADLEGLEFLSPGRFNHANLRQTNANPGWSKVPGKWVRNFDCRQSSVFTGSPVEWRQTLRPIIDNLAMRIMNDVRFFQGYFVILGNPIDTALLQSSDWQFTDEVSDEMGGVPITYRVRRTIGGAYPYLVVDSQNEPQRDMEISDYFQDNQTRMSQQQTTTPGAGGVLAATYKPRVTGVLRLFFIPTSPDQVSYRMFPYSFTVSNNNDYRNPNAEFVKSVVAHRRYVFDSFTKTMGIINILNNDGSYTQ